MQNYLNILFISKRDQRCSTDQWRRERWSPVTLLLFSLMQKAKSKEVLGILYTLQCSLGDSIREKWKSLFWFLKRKNIIDFTSLPTGRRLSLTPGLKILENFIKRIHYEQLIKEPVIIHEKQKLNWNQQSISDLRLLLYHVWTVPEAQCSQDCSLKERMWTPFLFPKCYYWQGQCESKLYTTKHSKVLNNSIFDHKLAGLSVQRWSFNRYLPNLSIWQLAK